MGHEHVVRPIVQCCQRQQKYITGSGHAKKACVQPSCTPLPAAPPLLPWGTKPDTSPFLPAWKSCQQQIWVVFCGHLEGGEGPSGGRGSQEATRGLALGDRVWVQCGNTHSRLLHLFGLCASGGEVIHLSFTPGQPLAITPCLPMGEDRLPPLSLPLLPMNQSPV